jgi:vesicle transport through interaction with t-SNAREs protein 1
VSILQDLHKQRETIVHTRETLHGADDNIGKSRRILASMAKRALQNKVMLGAVIGILIMCIFLIIVVRFTRSFSFPLLVR